MITVPVSQAPPKRPTPARRRWLRLALPLVAVSVLIGSIGVVGYRYLSEETRRETHRTLVVIAEQKRQQIEDSLAETRTDAELYFASRSQLEMLFRRWLNSGRKDTEVLDQIRSRMQEVARVRGWGGLAVVDSDARPVVVVGKADVRDHVALIKDILREPRIEFVDLHRTADGEVLYGVLAPIGASGDKPLGVAYLTWKAEKALYPLVESWPVPTRTAETYLVRRDGNNVRFLTPLRHRAVPALSLAQPLDQPSLPAGRAAKGEHGILAGGRDYRNVPVLAYASPVGGTPWLMLAEIDEVEAYAGIHNLAWATGLVVGLGLLFVYSAGYLLWRRERERQEIAALQAQQAAEARFRVIFEQAPLGVALLDSRGSRITEANARFAEIVGLAPAAMVGLDPVSLTHPDDAEESRHNIAALNAGEIDGYRLIKRYLRPDGSVVWVSLSCAPVQVANEDRRRYLAIVEDITARKEMEERLQISETRHRLLADNAVDVIVTMDLDGHFSYISPSVERLRGYSAEEAIGQPLAEVLTPDSLRIAEAYFGRLKSNRAKGEALEHFRGELEVCRRDGSSVWTDVSASPLLGAEGDIIEILGVIRDVSERKRYEYKLRQASAAAEAANAAKSEFLAHMSHEIRTPMNAVLGLAQVLEREPLAGHQHDMVQRIRMAGQSLLAILNDVLDLSKIEAGQLRIEQRPFDLAVLLANLDSLMGQNARSKGLALRIDGPVEALGPLLGDGLRLEQILFNLTGNAIKFTERGEVAVHVRTRVVDDMRLRLRFEVRDTGIGIDPEALNRLFAPFAQADAGIGRRFGGTGLGLSICKRLVELMDGEIGADSQPGTGSCFWFELPLQRASEAEMAAMAVAAAPPKPAGPRLVGCHLLVVDDSAMNRDLVERALRLEGASSTLAADGLQAIQILQTRPERFDAVLMDVQMPVMDGLTAMRLIRGELGLIDLPVIAFTAGVRDEQQAAARAAGANDVLAKPMDLEQMALMLARWVHTGRSGTAVLPTPPAELKSVGAAVEPVSVVAAQAAEGEATADFPEIPGIDRERAVQRLGRDREMFLGLLELFVHDNAKAADQARQALADGDREAAGRRMHTLGSNAGFLCAFDLMASARALEAAIDRGETELDEGFDTLESEIGEFVEASAPWR